MPAGCKDPDEVLTRHGADAGARLVFALERAEPGAAWLARHQPRRWPPGTIEQTAQLREATADAAWVMPASARARYDEIFAEALGISPAALLDDWARRAAELREQAVRERLRQWAQACATQLQHGVLTDRVNEAARRITAARVELAGTVKAGSPLSLAATRLSATSCPTAVTASDCG
jgi:hypothetical protein